MDFNIGIHPKITCCKLAMNPCDSLVQLHLGTGLRMQYAAALNFSRAHGRKESEFICRVAAVARDFHVKSK